MLWRSKHGEKTWPIFILTEFEHATETTESDIVTSTYCEHKAFYKYIKEKAYTGQA
jgi:hypothetical protein